MPSPVAHSIAGACAACLAARQMPAALALPAVAAALLAANLPDTDLLAGVLGREAVERFHQGPFHSILFVAVATIPLALLLRRRLGFSRAWLLLAGAGCTHLLLDMLVVDRRPPVGLPLFWPLSTARLHSPLEIFPGIERAAVFSVTNLREFIVEVAWGVPALLLAGWRPLPGRARGRLFGTRSSADRGLCPPAASQAHAVGQGDPAVLVPATRLSPRACPGEEDGLRGGEQTTVRGPCDR